MSKVCIIVPCYNEQLRLPANDLLQFARNHSEVDFILVNDGSTDKTWDLLCQIASSLPSSVHALNLEKNAGKAEAIRSAVLAAPAIGAQKGKNYDYIGYWDADLATPLEEILIFKKRLEIHKNLLYIMGARVQLLGTAIKRKATRHYLGRIFATAVSNILQLPVYDTQCGAKLIETALAEKLFSAPFLTKWFFDVELLARIRASYTYADVLNIVAEQPLQSWQDIGGSKLRLKHMLGVPWQLWQIARHYRPTFK